jgi:hypothetical protein
MAMDGVPYLLNLQRVTPYQEVAIGFEMSLDLQVSAFEGSLTEARDALTGDDFDECPVGVAAFSLKDFQILYLH